uniref:Uncharacterized protein n=1 Tax=Anguilla anguilla TaxID=7936 RepID=A0A0E9R9R5_ANGAN
MLKDRREKLSEGQRQKQTVRKSTGKHLF